ncbi:ATP synthase F0 subunit B [Desulfovibrio mangrovi]|uniref:ATP synthase F0 subunit B n=1 Tax=Desulfovibrio mangrovi TaxID=2976983 RepID=UPI0022483EE2|nr:ATP synthase F0 subunit B [Desulfovibrio mangrovi]UZP69087.1 ATP synthase F0 subunit B [Desulfovibrio mangrovi]
MINLDITLVIQLVNFLVVLFVLNALLIRPIREIIKQRQDKMSGLLGDAEQFVGSAEAKLKNYEAALTEARKNATAEREKVKEAALVQEAGILAKANQEAQAVISASREKVTADVAKAMETLKGQVGALAGKATAKVLG